MTEPVDQRTSRRPRLSRERVLSAALAVADAGGLDALTIRTLAAELGVKPMSVYYHVANKDEILDGLVDLVFDEIDLPIPGREWRSELARRADSARAVLRKHRWAIGLLESRTRPGPATLRHHDAVLATFRAAGFPTALTAHAYALIDSYVYGFALQEASLPFEGPDSVGEVAGPITELMTSGDYPHLVDMAATYYTQPEYDFGDEFRFGLDLILDGLERSLASP
jgi:AcrR family transcriptional regulator